MADRLIDKLKEYLEPAQGRTVNLRDIRTALRIEPGSEDDVGLRKHMSKTLVAQRIISPSGKGDGVYKVVKRVKPVSVFGVGRERRPVYDLIFPRNYDTMMELDFAPFITVREGDLIVMGGVKSATKTTMCLNFCAENIDTHPILMGNEYTVMVSGHDGIENYEPSPRFLNRLDAMDVKNGGWVEWINDGGQDKFTLLPVHEDHAEHIVRDRLNIIDWISLDGDRLYDIATTLKNIKNNLGRGVAIVALQKGEGAANPRGGQFVRDYADAELLLDDLGNQNYMLTVKGVKESTAPIVGNRYAYTVGSMGTKIIAFREIKTCPSCNGKKWYNGKECDTCVGRGYIDA